MTPITDIEEQQRNEENTKLNYITPEIQKKWSAEGGGADYYGIRQDQ